MDYTWTKSVLNVKAIRIKLVILIMLGSLVQGCAALSAWGVLSSVSNPGVSAHLDVGDKTVGVEGTTIGKKEESKVDTKVEGVSAQREVKVDSSTQKKDQKTEIGEVHGDVEVVQGPAGSTLWFLYMGWVFLAAIPLGGLFYAYRRSRQK